MNGLALSCNSCNILTVNLVLYASLKNLELIPGDKEQGSMAASFETPILFAGRAGESLS